MARPIKPGLDYSPQDTDIHSDRKIIRLIHEFSAKGYLVWDYIKCQCFKNNGYWTQFDQHFCFDVARALQCGLTENTVNEILQGCFRLGLFDEQVFKVSGKITSSGIQKRFLLAKRGGQIDDNLKVNAALTEVIAAETPVIAAITSVITQNPPVIAAESTQSKVKESKGKEKEDSAKAPLSPRQSGDEYIKKLKEEFKKSMEPYKNEYSSQTLNAFYRYWSEATPAKTQLRWQREKTWEINLRLKKWQATEQNFSKNGQTNSNGPDSGKPTARGVISDDMRRELAAEMGITPNIS